jgi:hypothetical protein
MYNLWPFGSVCSQLVNFFPFWDQEKSGNPVHNGHLCSLGRLFSGSVKSPAFLMNRNTLLHTYRYKQLKQSTLDHHGSNLPSFKKAGLFMDPENSWPRLHRWPLCTGLPDFSWSQNGKNTPNDHKLYQTAINYTERAKITE